MGLSQTLKKLTPCDHAKTLPNTKPDAGDMPRSASNAVPVTNTLIRVPVSVFGPLLVIQ